MVVSLLLVIILYRCRQVSTALVYAPNTKHASTEEGEIAPWTTQARYKWEAEQEVLAVASRGLNVVILRPAFVYGQGDTHMVMTRAACAAVYAELDEKMSLLWDAGLKLNTVHVEDVVRAMWHVVAHEGVGAGTIWNLCDKNDTDQGKVCMYICVYIFVYIFPLTCACADECSVVLNLPDTMWVPWIHYI